MYMMLRNGPAFPHIRSRQVAQFRTIITARIQRMREGNSFSLFTLAGRGYTTPGLGRGGGNPSQVWMGGGGVPYSRFGWGVLHPKSGGYPIPGLGGECTIPGLGGGYPIPGPDGGRGTPSQVWMGGTPSQVWTGGTPGYPCHHDWMGYSPTMTGWGTPTMTGWGTPHHDWMGYPLPPIRQSSIASTCYVAGGMPLAFLQEDFLVEIMNFMSARYLLLYVSKSVLFGNFYANKCIFNVCSFVLS